MGGTRVAFISDLHANTEALDAVFADIDRLGVDAVVCLGDIVDLGPSPREVIARLDARGVRCIQGNHDPLDEQPRHPRLLAIEAWTRDQLDDASARWLAALPERLTLDLGGVSVLCVHGSPRADTDQILADTPRETLDAWIGDARFDVLVGGHTHVQLLRRLDHRVILNVGSASMPFARALVPGGGEPQVLPWAEYGVITSERGVASFDLRRVPFDIPAHVARVRASTFPEPEIWVRHWVR